MEWEYSYFIIDSKQLEVSGEKWYPMHRLWKNQTPTGIIAIVHQSIFIGLYQGLSYPGGARAPVCPPDILTNRPRHKNCCAVSLQIMHSNVLGVLYRLNLNISFMHSILNYKMSNYIGVFSYLSSKLYIYQQNLACSARRSTQMFLNEYFHLLQNERLIWIIKTVAHNLYTWSPQIEWVIRRIVLFCFVKTIQAKCNEMPVIFIPKDLIVSLPIEFVILLWKGSIRNPGCER